MIHIIAIVYIFILLLMLAFFVIAYILQSLGLYTVAKRRGINKPWLSWLPIGQTWILGCLSDRFQSEVKNTAKNRRKILLWLSVAVSAMYIPFYSLYFISVLSEPQPSLADATFIGIIMACFAIALLMLVLSIILSVFTYCAYYDLFSSCSPSNAVAFLVVSIIVPVALPFIVFAVRKKDLGMPILAEMQL